MQSVRNNYIAPFTGDLATNPSERMIGGKDTISGRSADTENVSSWLEHIIGRSIVCHSTIGIRSDAYPSKGASSVKESRFSPGFVIDMQ